MAPHLFDSLKLSNYLRASLVWGSQKALLVDGRGNLVVVNVHLLFIYAVLSIGRMKFLI